YWPAALLLVGLAFEGWIARKSNVRAEIEMPPRALLGREQQGAYAFRNESKRPITLQYATAVPAGFELAEQTRILKAPEGGTGRDPFGFLPVRLGTQAWPPIPARLLGRF